MKPVHIGIAVAGGFLAYQLYKRYASAGYIAPIQPASTTSSTPVVDTGKSHETLTTDPIALYLPGGAFAMRAPIHVDDTTAASSSSPPPIPPAKIPPPGFKPPPPPKYVPLTGGPTSVGVFKTATGGYVLKTSSGGARPHGGTGAPSSGGSTGGDAEHAGKVFV